MDKKQVRLESILQQFKQDKDIEAIFLGGSIAEGTDDAYSDIDLRIVLSQQKDSGEKLENFVKHQENILMLEDFSSRYVVIHYTDFVKLDLFVYSKAEIKPSTWFSSISILQETNDQFLSKVKSKSASMTFGPTQAMVDQLIHKYIAYLHECYRKGKRGAIHYVEQCFLHMKHILISLYRLLAKEAPNLIGDWSKYEGKHSRLTREQATSIQGLSLYGSRSLKDVTERLNSHVRKSALRLSDEQAIHFDPHAFDSACRLVNFDSFLFF